MSNAEKIQHSYDNFTRFVHVEVQSLDHIELSGFMALIEQYASHAMERLPTEERIVARNMAAKFGDIK